MMHIIYHGNCPDGFGAAWAAWCEYGDKAIYTPAHYGEPMPEIDNNDSVVIADFSYPREDLIALNEHVVSLKVLDHHKTAQAALEGLDFCTFDMDKSGAMLSWEYFHHKDPPRLIEYVQDRDLWRFALDFSEEISAFIGSYPRNFHQWNAICYVLDNEFQSVVREGKAILRYKRQQVEEMCKQATELVLFGAGAVHTVPVVNASVSFSEVGNELCKQNPDAPFAAYYFDRGDGKRQFGLRSIGDFDVSAVAKAHGGGGHKNAAGFVTEIPS